MNRSLKHVTRSPYGPIPLRRGNCVLVTCGFSYDLAADDPGVVRILAIGVKRRNRLVIAGKEVQL